MTTHPTWCTRQHAGPAEHRSAPRLVLLPHAEQITAVLAADLTAPDDPVAEIVHSDQATPATHPLDPTTISWLIVPCTHLAQLAGALSDLATLATPGGTR
jgi:hypothetical protein